MKTRSFPDETPCSRRPDFSGDEFPRKIERCQLPLVFDVKMWRFVIIEEHSNDDPKKR